MKRITNRQRHVLAFIYERIASDLRPPSIEEIMQAIGVTNLSTVSYHVNALRRKGFLERPTSGARHLVVTEAGRFELGAKEQGASPERLRALEELEQAVLDYFAQLGPVPEPSKALRMMAATLTRSVGTRQ